MRFLIISILLSTVFPSVYSADSGVKIVTTLAFGLERYQNSERYQKFFENMESLGADITQLQQNLTGKDTDLIREIKESESIPESIKQIIINTVRILHIPTHITVQDALSPDDFKPLNELIFFVIQRHYRLAIGIMMGSMDDIELESKEIDVSTAIQNYKHFTSNLITHLDKDIWLSLLTPDQIGKK